MARQGKGQVPNESAHYSNVAVLGGLSVLDAFYHTHAFPPHFHDTFVIGVLESGFAAVRCESEIRTLGPSDILVINPGAVHSAGAASAEGWRYRAFYPTQDLVRSIMGELEVRDDSVFSTMSIHDPALARQVRHAAARLTSPTAELEREQMLVTVMTRLWQHATHRRQRQSPKLVDEPRLRRARELIDDRLDQPVLLADLAREVNMSRFHLIRAFTRQYGVTPYAYFVDRRVQMARRELERGTKPARVADMCGFSDQSHLNRHFKRIVGVTPAAYVTGVLRKGDHLRSA